MKRISAVIVGVAVVVTLSTLAGVSPVLFIVNDRVGIGTQTPGTTLDVLRSDGTAQLAVREESAERRFRDLLFLENNGPVRMQFVNTGAALPRRWRVGVGSNHSFEISRVGSGCGEFKIDNAGTVTTCGALYQNSSRALKRDIAPVSAEEILDALRELEVASWSYRRDLAGVRHLGPMAEEFHAAFGLGADASRIAPLDAVGVALAALKGQQALIDDQAKRLVRQEAALAELTRRLDDLESR